MQLVTKKPYASYLYKKKNMCYCNSEKKNIVECFRILDSNLTAGRLKEGSNIIFSGLQSYKKKVLQDQEHLYKMQRWTLTGTRVYILVNISAVDGSATHLPFIFWLNYQQHK